MTARNWNFLNGLLLALLAIVDDYESLPKGKISTCLKSISKQNVGTSMLFATYTSSLMFLGYVAWQVIKHGGKPF